MKRQPAAPQTDGTDPLHSTSQSMATAPDMMIGWSGYLVAAIVLLSIILLAAACIDCGTKGPLVSIRQEHASDEYIPSFSLIQPYQPSSSLNSIHPSSTPFYHLSPSLSQAPIIRHQSFTPTENESIPSYENHTDGHDYESPPEDEDDDNNRNYIEVLPDPQPADVRRSSQSLASNQSSVETYVNVGKMPKGDDGDYINLATDDPGRPPDHPRDVSCMKATFVYDDDDDDDDDDGNYVNQPALDDDQSNA